MEEQIFAVGDIHGCIDKLKALIDKIPFDPQRDTIVFLGDYVDRGPSSYEVVEFLIELEKNCKNAVFLKGNHEEMLEDFAKGRDITTFLVNGGEQTVKSYMERTSRPFASPFPDEHMEFFKSLRLYYETEKFIFVHAGLRQGVPLDRQNTYDLLWNRHQFLDSEKDFGKKVVYGHTPSPEPQISDYRIGIDTGAVYGNKLTAVELNRMEFYSV